MRIKVLAICAAAVSIAPQSCSKESVPARFDRVELTDYEAYKSGNDWAPALAQACRESEYVHIPAGRYTMAAVWIPSGTTVEGDGSSTIIVPKEEFLFRIEGKAEAPVAVTEDIPDFSSNITVADASLFETGDMVLLQSQRNCMFKEDSGDWTLGQTTAGNKTCFFGELLDIKSVSGNVITTDSATLFPYYKSHNAEETVKPGFGSRQSSSLTKLNAVRDVVLSSLSVDSNSGCLRPVRVKYAENCTVKNVTVISDEDYEDEPSTLFMVLNSKGCRIIGCHSRYSERLIAKKLKNIVPTYSVYTLCNNFRIVSSDYCSIENCTDNFATHSFSVTYSDGGIPSAHCSIINCRSENSIWAGVVSQQCTPWTELSGNTVVNSSQGVMSGSRWSSVKNNKVTTSLPFSTDFYYAHISRGGTTGLAVFEGYGRGCEISGNEVSGFFSGIKVLDGYEKLNIFDGQSDIVITGNKVTDCVYGLMISRNQYNKYQGPLGVFVQGNSFKAAGMTVEADGERQTCGAVLDGADGVTLVGNTFSGFYMDIDK
ncbi:MAG: hypothetical protein ACI3ZT_06655 [Candidatus Cryptobacteroides sp.]